MKLLKRIKSFSQKQKIILMLSIFVIISILGMLVWAYKTGQIRPRATSNQISNTATVTYQDSTGNNYSAQSNTILVEIISSLDTMNLSYSLQGGRNYSVTGAIFTIYQPGTKTEVYKKSDVSIDSAGNSSFDITSPATGNYDYNIKVSGYLAKSIKNTVFTNPMTLSFGELKAGDLNGDNIVNLLDFISYFRPKYLQNVNQVAPDYNQDGSVNLADFILFRKNFMQSGD